jgi:EAL domain-containing protein (putative c-di-GMP-specific phosphodiesterase class I)
MMIVSLDGLDQYNKTNGYQAGDHMILEIAKLCEEYVTRLSAICTARINGSNFGLLLRETNSENLQKSCKELETAFIRLIQGEDHLQIYFAAASYSMHQTPRTLLEKVDGLLNEARQRGGFSGHSLSFDNSDDLHIEKQNLLEALNSNRFVLYSQRVTDGAVDFHEEILIRMLGDKSETIQNAGFFMPTAERLGLAHLIDQFVLKELSTHLFMENETVVAVNISKDTLVNKEHCDAYFEQLAKMPQELRTFIQTEVNEQLVLNHFDLASTFFEKIKKLGMKSGIDCVGLHLESMHYLLDLPITYLKLHGSLLQDISDNQKELFSINYFSKMAKTLDLEVIATQVEEKTQWEIIQALPIRWGQGMYLATSQPYSPSVDSNDPTTPS